MNKFVIRIRNLFYIEKYRQLISFGLIGLINSLVDFAVFSILKHFFNLHYEICYIIGYSAGILNSFLLNKYITFRNSQGIKKSIRQLYQFVFVNLISLGSAMLFMILLVDILNINVYLSKVTTTFLTLIINFIGSRLWVFKD